MSSTPGRRAAPKPLRWSDPGTTQDPQPGGGRRIADPPTGEVPVVRDDGDLPTHAAPPASPPASSRGKRSSGRRIRAAAPVSAAGDQREPGTAPASPAEAPAPSEPAAPPAPVPPSPVSPAGARVAPPIPVAGAHASFPRDPAAPQPAPAPVPPPAAPASVGAAGAWSAPAPSALLPVAPPVAEVPTSFPVDPSAPVAEPEPVEPAPGDQPAAVRVRTLASRMRLSIWSAVLAVGIVLLAAAALHVGPSWLDGVGAVLVVTTYSWAMMARTGGRPLVFSALALVLGTTAVLVDGPVLKSGAAVMTCVVSGVLAVVLTVPARTFTAAVRELVVATAVASVGAFATVGFEPVASTARFEYLTLGIGFAVMLMLVWRLAAGLHGLGTRGLGVIVVGTLVLALSIVYTELLRRFGASGLVEPGTELSGWLRENIGAMPRPIVVFLGVPALLWGVHMRARRRQGWWVCTFGAVATLPIAQRLVNLDTSYVEAGLQTAYSVALGVLVGWVVIRVDQALTGTRGSRARAAEEHDAVRPEPPRFSAL